MDLLGDLDFVAPSPAPAMPATGNFDLGDIMAPPIQEQYAQPKPVSVPAAVDPFGFDAFEFSEPKPTTMVPELPLVLPGEQFNGMTIRARIEHSNGGPVYKISISNNSPTSLSGLMLQFNRNSFGLQPSDQVSDSCLV